MKPHVSSYERGRNIVRVLVVLAIILGVSALMFTHENSREQMFLVIASAACVVGVLVVARLLSACLWLCGFSAFARTAESGL